MKRFWRGVKRFFAPPSGSSKLARIAPYLTVAFIMLVLFRVATTAWEFTNQTQFCGLTCHTMPPEYNTHKNSAHANVICEDCHLGRDTLNVMLIRKIESSWQTGTAMITGNYHFPIVARNMRPAREACENCHNPEKFSRDKLFELKRFSDDKANTLTRIYLLFKTGGGMPEQGLGNGIHWHVVNPVYYYASDPERQEIPYMLVTRADGSTSEYVDVNSNFDPKSIRKEDLQVMDCITCHNRIAHEILSPSDEIDNLLERGVVSPAIPEIHALGKEILSMKFETAAQASAVIDALGPYYQQNYPDFYQANAEVVNYAIKTLKQTYQDSVFLDQDIDWSTHPDNNQHKNSPGCFRCHDGKHISPNGKDMVRLECNLCHSIPTVSTNFELVSGITVVKGIEPASHNSPNWINEYRSAFDNTCQTCHTVSDAGGTSNTSFCSNSVCHGADWQFVSFDKQIPSETLKQLIIQQSTAVSVP